MDVPLANYLTDDLTFPANLLLALGTGILVAVTWTSSPGTSAVLVAGFVAALVLGSFRPARMFLALLGVVVLDVVALIASPAL